MAYMSLLSGNEHCHLTRVVAVVLLTLLINNEMKAKVRYAMIMPRLVRGGRAGKAGPTVMPLDLSRPHSALTKPIRDR